MQPCVGGIGRPFKQNTRPSNTCVYEVPSLQKRVYPTFEERIFMGLRLIEGVSVAEIPALFGERIEKLKNQGLLIEKSGRIFIPPELLFVSNRIMLEFVD